MTARRFLLVGSSAGGGDVDPILAIAVGLRDRGHDVRLWCDPAVASWVAELGVRTIVDDAAWTRADPRAVRAALEREGPVPGNPFVRYFRRVCGELAPAVNRAFVDVEADVLVVPLLMVGVGASLAAAAPRWCAVNSTYYRGKGAKRPLEADFAEPAVFESLSEALFAAPLVLHATDRVFDLDTTLPAGHHYTGPLLWERLEATPLYLNEPGPPWALLTSSSVPQPGEEGLVKAAIEALATRPVRVVLTSPVAPEHVPPNVRVERHVSHQAVLARSAVFVGHAGHVSVMKALWHGVPMVLAPWGRDQPGVAARAELLGVARVVPKDEVNSERIGSALDLVLGAPSFRDTASAHGRRLRATDPVASACQLLETL